MFRYCLAGAIVCLFGTFSAFAHTTDHPHPHPHSMDLFSSEGAVTLAVMFVAVALLFILRGMTSSKRSAIKSRRGEL